MDTFLQTSENTPRILTEGT